MQHLGDRSHTAMTTTEVAEEYLSLCRRGEFDEAMARFFSADHGFAGENEIHSFDVEGPFVGGNQFAARFSIDMTSIPTGSRMTIRKLDLYTVDDGTIVRSEIYYNTPPLSAG